MYRHGENSASYLTLKQSAGALAAKPVYNYGWHCSILRNISQYITSTHKHTEGMSLYIYFDACTRNSKRLSPLQFSVFNMSDLYEKDCSSDEYTFYIKSSRSVSSYFQLKDKTNCVDFTSQTWLTQSVQGSDSLHLCTAHYCWEKNIDGKYSFSLAK